MKQINKKLVIYTLITQLVIAQTLPVTVLAEEPTPQPTQTPAAEVTPAPQETTTTTSSPAPTAAPQLSEEERERQELLERRARSEAAKEQYIKEQGDIERTQSSSSATAVGTDPVNQGGKIGQDSTVNTGTANANGAILNAGNTNTSAGVNGNTSGATVTNSGNGAGSANTGTVTNNNGSATVQENNSNLNNNLSAQAISGNNDNSKNTGSNSTTTTGDANVSGTIINSTNTNVDGVLVAEFNIADIHTGDLILDFGAGCVSGCGDGSSAVTNSSNGSGSTNNGTVYDSNDKSTTQLNDALIGNELNLHADSGNNTSNKNTGGDTTIKTGDANVAGNILNFANTNVAGNVIYAAVNIFGDLVGDIILTEDAIKNCCGNKQVAASNTGNGTNTDNNAVIDINNDETYLQTNDAVIDNNLNLDAQTGNNSASNNTGGNSDITTGDVSVDANILNIANTNILGGNMWLVIVNEAGNWVGKLMGAPEGSKFAGSEGFGFTVDENGYITASNNGNGANSDNNSTVEQNNTNTTTQTNTANLQNNMNLSANTGGNQASNNTGGNSNITTGDATIIANLVNFVNTNIAGNGTLVVSVVNVFGSWIGDFVTPGHQKANKTPAANNTANTNTGNSNNINNSSHSEKKHNAESEKKTDNGSEEIAIETSSEVAYESDNASYVRGGTLTGDTVKAKVAGANATNDEKNVIAKAVLGQSDTNGTMKLNLAWLVLALPLGVILFTARSVVKRFAR